MSISAFQSKAEPWDPTLLHVAIALIAVKSFHCSVSKQGGSVNVTKKSCTVPLNSLNISMSLKCTAMIVAYHCNTVARITLNNEHLMYKVLLKYC